MTSFKFHYRTPLSGQQATGRVFIRVIHQREYREIRRNYPLHPSEWDSSSHWLRLPAVMGGGRGERLSQIESSMKADLARLESIVTALSASGPYTLGDIVDAFHKGSAGDTVLSFALKVASQLEGEGRVRTARAYRSAARSIVKFNHGRDMPLCGITAVVMRDYERWLLDCGLQMNTVSFYMRNLRALYYRGVACRVVRAAESNPFENVYTGVYETRRRCLDREEINSMAALEKKLP
ncbi:MAG: phage integrase SAM-like domain-containing protein, partial [Alistipes sp.]|nr:phage integrase SAM-like domain-containing protein [Alistipes sp.]